MTTGEKVRLVRELLEGDLTQEEFAKRLNTTATKVRNWELGRTEFPKSIAQQIASEVGFDWQWFYTNDPVLPFGRRVMEPVSVYAKPGTATLPLYPEVPAGHWETPPEGAIGYVGVPVELAGNNRFACRVVGDSLMPKVQHGDVAIFQESKDLRPGVVTLVRNDQNEAAAKVVERQGQSYRLTSVNAAYPALEARGWSIVGYMIGLIREVGGGATVTVQNPSGIRVDHLP